MNNKFLKYKKQILNSKEYTGDMDYDDFPFEIGDWIIEKGKENACKVIELYYFKKGENPDIFEDNSPKFPIVIDNYRYATLQEIQKAIENKKDKYRPLTWEDRNWLKGKWIKHRYTKDFKIITTMRESTITGKFLINSMDNKVLDRNFVFEDGSPCKKLKTNK